ncbi:MAG: prepilin-type N-terminal cleavage/methylation domain-containing protein [Betaproteobacteria bacterium]|nr:prepilin-type N-terminal cleavage/methylation domain-containing protein [Betaproteobacteria bacterium]
MSDIPPVPRGAPGLPATPCAREDAAARRRARLRELGYTMLEVMVAVGIVAVIATFAVRAYDRYLDRTKAATAVSDILELSNRIKSFELNNRRLPESLDEIGRGGVADPWGRPYQYFNLEVEKGNGQARQRKNLKPLNTDYDLYSIGPDGQTAVRISDDTALDDVVRGLNGRFTGFARDLDPTASNK